MFWLMNTDYRKLRQPRVIFTALSVTLLLLIAVFFLDRSHATHRWIRIGPLSLQPSELAKLVVIFYLAWFLEFAASAYESRTATALGSRSVPAGIRTITLRSILPVGRHAAAGRGLVVVEPDMGTACMISLIAFVMLFVSGLSYRYVVGAVLAALPVVYLLIVRVPYRLQRVQTFFSPGADPQGHGFQLLQSLIAVGSGGFTRRGPDGKPPEAFLSARGAHRFHFLGDLRGGRLHRRGDRAGAVRGVRLARVRRRHEGAG